VTWSDARALLEKNEEIVKDVYIDQGRYKIRNKINYEKTTKFECEQ
jgi:hypothetical protein